MTLPAHEQSVLDRLKRDGNPLGWRPEMRNKQGEAVIRCDVPIPRKPGWVRISRAALTTRGLVHYRSQEVKVDGA